MIFKTITLHNLFCYDGKHPFDLLPSEADKETRNIVVIMGRNGFGKTSFLNSVKLLFGGVTKELRHGVQRGNAHSEKAFVLGAKEWWGILNHQAKKRGEFDCYVEAVLIDENHQEITVKRSWNLRDDDYHNRIEVAAPRKPPLTGDNAQQYLSGLLPLDYIPFFFFDAEEIGYLAEANDNQIIEKMEQLLNIRPADNLRDCIKDLIKKVERESIKRDAKLELLKAEHRHDELQIEQQNLNEQCQAIEFDIDVLETDLRETRQKIRVFSGQGMIENNAKLEAAKQAQLKNKEEALTSLSELFERDAFLRLNADKVQQTLPAVERCAHNQHSVTKEMLDSLHEPLKAVFTTPPYLDGRRLEDRLIKFYQNRIAGVLNSRDVNEDDSSPFRLESWQAKKILGLLGAYTSQHAPETPIRDLLSRALQAERAIDEIDKNLLEVSLLSEESRLRLSQLQEQQEQQSLDVEQRRKDLHEVKNKLSSVERELIDVQGKTEGLRKQARQSEQGQLRITLLEKMLKLLDSYKQALKVRQRAVLEDYFNRHLASLLDSNQLISKIKIDESFQFQLLRSDDSPIAMGSISAGMKQLAATALIWALKDACGKQLPVVIDTPLGRIDKQHQDNLLNRYYPKAARQVILLPTDSELDERKRELLAPYIYREYHLHNRDGDKTHVELMPSGKAVNNG